MTTRGLPADATIASIQHLLGSKEDYVRQAFHNAHTIRKTSQLSPVLVRIGITGIGDSPNYRVEVLDGEGSVVGDPATFRGDNHGPLFKDNAGLAEQRWSTEAMDYDQVRDLLGEIRNIRRK